MPKRNPHNCLMALSPPGEENRRWYCKYCGAEGLYEELQAAGCSYTYPPCKYCGQTPECALDCPGMMELLSGPDVHFVSDDAEMKARVDRVRRQRGNS